MKKTDKGTEFLELLEKFFTEYLPNSVNASPNTITSYKCAFRLLFQYIQDETEIKVLQVSFEQLNFDLLDKFFNWLLNTRGNSRTTAKQRMGALASFADYAGCRSIEAGYTFMNSIKKISQKSLRRVKGKQRSAFTRKEIEILFSIPDTTTKTGWRDLVILCVMYSSGARAQEICDLVVKAISYDEKGNAILTFTGKGQKTRRVKITTNTTQMLEKYIDSRRIRADPECYVFPSQRNDHLSVSAIEEIYEKYILKAKALHPEMFCNGPYTPHVMRHTTATHLIEAGVPLPIVKNILGHSSIQTTQIYLDLSQQTIDRTVSEWNEKWFSKHTDNEVIPQQETDTILGFLK